MVPNRIESGIFMYIRKKRIKGYEYAYLVQNRWKKHKGSRQKVKGYLGRVYKADKVKEQDFFRYTGILDLNQYLASKDTKHIIRDLLRWELSNHGFMDMGNGIWQKGNICFDFAQHSLFLKGGQKIKPMVLEMNEGFMCSQTLARLISFNAKNSVREGYRLAQLFLEAGILVPKEIFVGIFSKIQE